MPFTTNGGVRIHWEERGSGTPLLLIMGHRYSSALWYPILDALAAKHRVIFFDNRGTGDSDAPAGFTVGDMTRDALVVMDAAGVQRAHVFGISMGGVITLELAMQAPERAISLVLAGTGVLTPEKQRLPSFILMLYYLPNAVLRFLMPRKNKRGYGTAAPDDRIAYDEAMVAKDKNSTPALIAQAKAVAAHNTTLDAVARLTMPALVLHGGEDGTVQPAWGEELAATLPDSRFVKFEGAGHNFLVADGDKAARVVLDFLSSVDGAATA